MYDKIIADLKALLIGLITDVKSRVTRLQNTVLGTAATGVLTFAANAANTETIVVNGVTVTFRSTVVASTVLIAATKELTAIALATFLNASVDALLTGASYEAFGAKVLITYDTKGTAGNAFTLADSSGGHVTRGAATLTSGADGAFGGNSTGNIGYLNIPQNSKSAAYELVLSDVGKHIYHPVGDANARAFTIPANAAVAFPIGSPVTFVNDSPNDITVVITTDVLAYADVGTITTLTIPQYNMATILKVTPTRWLASGTAGCTTA